MNITTITRKIIPIVLLLAIVAPISAQNDSQNTHPLLDLLAYVPDTEVVGDIVYYADIQASAETVIGEPQDSVRQAWETLGYPDDFWVGWLPMALPRFRNYLIVLAEDDGQSIGLDVKTIERTIYFGQPPSDAMILQGDFDTDTIVDAFTAQSHELQPRDDVTLLCSIDGCDDGRAIHVEERNPLNPFGGEFGRHEPIALLDDLILNSPDFGVVESMIQSGDGEMASLADSSDYQAVVTVATRQGALRQAILASTENPAFWDVEEVIPLVLPEEKREMLEDKVTPLPPYNLLMMADTASLDTQTQAGLVLLVYNSEAAANRASDALQANLAPDGLTTINTDETLHSIMAKRGEMQFEVIADDATGRYILQLSIQAPLIEIPESDDETQILAGQQFRLFLLMLYQRDILWLIYDREVE